MRCRRGSQWTRAAGRCCSWLTRVSRQREFIAESRPAGLQSSKILWSIDPVELFALRHTVPVQSRVSRDELREHVAPEVHAASRWDHLDDLGLEDKNPGVDPVREHLSRLRLL